MKLTLLLLLISCVASAQSKFYIRADSTYIQKTGGNNELILENGTRTVKGVLTNIGGGRTRFIASRVSGDTLFVGMDTLLGVGGGASVWGAITGTFNDQTDVRDTTRQAYTNIEGVDSSGIIIGFVLRNTNHTKRDTVLFASGGDPGLADSMAAVRSALVDTALAIRADFPTGGSGVTTMAPIGSSPNANGATILGTTLTLQPANGSFGGVLTTAAQTIAGAKTLSSNPLLSAISANRVLYTTTGGEITSTANFNFDGSFGRLAGSWAIGAGHSGTSNQPLEVTGMVNFANATAISGVFVYQRYGGWDVSGAVSPSGTTLLAGGIRASQWIQYNIRLSGVDRINVGATETVINESGADLDWRAEGDNDANALVIDASTDRVGIGVAAASTTEKLHLAGNFRFSGALMPNNNAGTTGQVLLSGGTGGPNTWGPVLASGTYTPTISNGSNVDATTTYAWQYSRVGSTVTVSGKIEVDATAVTNTTFQFTLPVASAFTDDGQAAGGGGETYGRSAVVTANVANDLGQFYVLPVDAANRTYYITFTYQIL